MPLIVAKRQGPNLCGQLPQIVIEITRRVSANIAGSNKERGMSLSKFLYAIALLIPITLGSIAFGQQNGFPPDKRIESRQGYPAAADVISHKFVSKGTHMMCMHVQSHPKQGDDGAACLLKFQDGSKKTLDLHETMQAPSDGEVYLECLGDKPTKCAVGLY